MRQHMIAALAAGGLVFSAGAALANGGDKCFDKGTLTYVDCNPVNWTGWYLGAHAGYDPDTIDGTFNGLDLSNLELQGFLAGGQLAYLEQFDSGLVLGLEIDASAVWADDQIENGVRGQTRNSVEAELNWLASARVRLGLSQGEWLPYVTGGVALAGFEATASTPVSSINVDTTAFGGVAGGGVEVMLDPNWTLGVEGLYYFFDETESLSPPGAAGDHITFGDVAVGRVRLNYKF